MRQVTAATGFDWSPQGARIWRTQVTGSPPRGPAGGDMLGRRIGDYVITALLAEGGMGVVYQAQHLGGDRGVAIKVLRPPLALDAGIVRRFHNEARVSHRVRHPGLVPVSDHGLLPEGVPYLVMELLEGETLARRLDRSLDRRLPIGEAVGIAGQTAQVLAAVHAAGVVHRDLKPENLFLVPEARVPGRRLVKVLDFGVARMTTDTIDPVDVVDTQAGSLLGTLPYMSPEQCRGLRQGLDHRTDVYALGIILYEMLCGAPPFVSPGCGELMMMHMTSTPRPPSHHRQEVPPALERVILRALAKRPAQRFGNMTELADALRASVRRPARSRDQDLEDLTPRAPGLRRSRA